jgi:hypothetical protein
MIKRKEELEKNGYLRIKMDDYNCIIYKQNILSMLVVDTEDFIEERKIEREKRKYGR